MSDEIGFVLLFLSGRSKSDIPEFTVPGVENNLRVNAVIV
jgi:hypothetical protein